MPILPLSLKFLSLNPLLRALSLSLSHTSGFGVLVSVFLFSFFLIRGVVAGENVVFFMENLDLYDTYIMIERLFPDLMLALFTREP